MTYRSSPLTRFRMIVFPLIVLLLQLRLGPRPQGHTPLSTATGHSHGLPCKTTMNRMHETSLHSRCPSYTHTIYIYI